MTSGSIDKALAVLEALAQHSRLADIAADTGLAKSTVHRILQSLVGSGFARADGDGGYLPGPQILTLAGRVMNRFDPARHAGPALRDLRDTTGLPVHFAIRNGDEAVYLEKLEGSRPYQMRSRIGMSIPLHTTAIGKVVLAHLAPAEVGDIVARTGLTRVTEKSITSAAALRRQLDEARARGYAIDAGENDPGICCLAAAVFDHTGAVMGGVSVSGLAFDLDLTDPALIEAVTAGARAASLALGAPPERILAPPA
jgi:DNA-binding IclR family transcriptional regulator